jgi:multidrug resistance protein, MATE family
MIPARYREHFKNTIILAYPVCLSQLGHVMVGVVDTAMVGSIDEALVGYSGTTAQAAALVANGFVTLVLVFCLGISYGATPLIAAADSQGDHEQNRSLLKHGFIVNVSTSVVLVGLMVLCSPLLYYIKQPDEVIELAIPFMNVMLLGLMPLAIFSAFKQFAEGLSFTRTAMIITLAANGINILLNWVLINGKWGFEPMGIMGSAWASFISRVMMALSMWLYVFYGKQFSIYWKGFASRNISWQLMKKMYSIGIPSGLQWVFEVGAFSVSALMLGTIGKTAQAAHSVAISVAAITYMIASGLGAAATVRIGNFMGLRDRTELRKAGFTAFGIALGFMFFCAVLFIIFKDQLPWIFTKDAGVAGFASSLLIIAAFFQLSDGLQVVCLGVLRGMKDVKIPTAVTMVAYWVIGLPVSYVLAFPLGLGVDGVWYGLMIALTIAAVLLFWRFNYLSKRVEL